MSTSDSGEQGNKMFVGPGKFVDFEVMAQARYAPIFNQLFELCDAAHRRYTGYDFLFHRPTDITEDERVEMEAAMEAYEGLRKLRNNVKQALIASVRLQFEMEIQIEQVRASK